MILTRLLGQAIEVMIDMRLHQIPITMDRFKKVFENPGGNEDFLAYWEGAHKEGCGEFLN